MIPNIHHQHLDIIAIDFFIVQYIITARKRVNEPPTAQQCIT